MALFAPWKKHRSLLSGSNEVHHILVRLQPNAFLKEYVLDVSITHCCTLLFDHLFGPFCTELSIRSK